MDALSIPDMQRSLSAPPELTATTMSAEKLKCLGKASAAGSFCEGNAEFELSVQHLYMPDERSKQCEVPETALARHDPANQVPGISPSVGAYSAQCAKCMKWRFIPTKAHFEAIRHSILERPFFCSSATPWHPNASCNDPFEISPDVHELWAFDKPGIPLPPDGWERLLVIRPPGSIKFGDIYYVTPTGKRIRSMPELERFLSEHPEYFRGVKLSQFSFFTPRPFEREHSMTKYETLVPGHKSTMSGKASYCKGASANSQLNNLAPVQPPLKATSMKPKFKKLKLSRKAIGVSDRVGKSKSANRSFAFAAGQVIESPLSHSE